MSETNWNDDDDSPLALMSHCLFLAPLSLYVCFSDFQTFYRLALIDECVFSIKTKKL